MDNQTLNQLIAAFGGEYVRMVAEALDRKLAERGVSDLGQLRRTEAEQLYRSALFEVAAKNPTADLALLDRLVTALFRDDVMEALQRVRAEIANGYPPIRAAMGKDAALVLAFFGLPVAPLDLDTGDFLAPPSADFDQVAATFDAFPGATVAYSTCNAQFYVLFTECMNSLARMISEVSLGERVRALFERDNQPLPQANHQPLTRGCGIFRRYPGETVGSFIYGAERDDAGLVVLYAGWTENGQPKGAVPGGRKYVPLQLVELLLGSPDAHSFVRGDPKPVPAMAN